VKDDLFLFHLFHKLDTCGCPHDRGLVHELAGTVTTQCIDSLYVEALGNVQEDVAKLVVPLVGGTLIVANEDEQIRLAVLAMISIDLISNLLDGAVPFYHHLGRKMRRVDFDDLFGFQLFYHVIGY